MDVVSPKLAEEYLYWAVVEHVRGWLGEDGAFRRAIEEKRANLIGSRCAALPSSTMSIEEFEQKNLTVTRMRTR
jgi:hypothetical protein